MKLVILIVLLIVVVISCYDGISNQLIKSIPGTYIRFSIHEFGTEYDTIMISFNGNSNNHFRIVRRWKYERVLDGNQLSPEYRRQVTNCIYDEKVQILREVETGESYSFDDDGKRLYNGGVEYLKIK